MVNTKILLSVVIVLLIGVAAATYHVTTTTPGLWQPTTSQGDQKSADQGTSTQSGSQQSGTQTGSQSGTQTQSGTSSQVSQSGNGESDVGISTTEAKSLAKTHIGLADATAGTPILKLINGKKVYVVPVIYNGKQAGEIWIDAQTGKCIGGAGGAP